MIEDYLMAFVKAFRAGADAIERQIKQLKEMGVDLEDIQNPQEVVDVIKEIADTHIEETFECEVYKGFSSLH